MKRIVLSSLVFAFLLFFGAVPPSTEADGSYFDLSGSNFSQDWTTTTLITVDDNWSGVFNVQGFRGDNLTGGTGTDPQTLTLDDTPGVLDVIANQANPDTNVSGGVAEFDGITNPTFAFQGSGTADAPYLELHVDTTGRENVQVSYNLRDIDGSADNSVQPVALQYRVGTSGTFTNVPAGFVADASTGPSLANLVTPVSATLPAAVNDQSQVQIRIITANAVGSDEWIGIDDIVVASAPILSGDSTGPLITYSSFGTTGSTANRVLAATILDDVEVASGAVAPRIYFRKNAGTYFSTQCVLTSGNTQAGVYDCTVDNSLMGGVAPGDTIGYFVIAQDTAGNVASNPSGAIATDVNTVTIPPTANTYILLQTFAGSVSVGTDQPVQSLTNNGGLFELMNASTISGHTVVNLTTDLTAETGTHPLNQLIEEGAGNWNITFQSSGGARLILGQNNALGLILLNGADRVAFSGLAFGPDGLTIRNTGTGSTIRFFNDASNNLILDCAVEGESSSGGVVRIFTGSSTGNDSNTISDSTIRDRSDAIGVPGILIRVDSATGPSNSNTTISNNTLLNFVDTAVSILGTDNTAVTGNTITQSLPRATQLTGIALLGSNTGITAVSQNIIRDNNAGLGFAGIVLGDAVGTTVSRNRIFSNSTGSGAFYGIWSVAADSNANATVVNNMLSMIPAADPAFIAGMFDNGTAGALNLLHNTVFVGGTSAGNNSWAYHRSAGSPTNSTVSGNIFFNDRTGGGNHFAAGDGSANQGSWSSNYNIFAGTGSTPANFMDYGTSGAGTPIDFATWQAGPPTRDADSLASIAGAGPFNVANMFVSTTDLHLKVTANNPAINAGTSTGTTTDFDGQGRPFNGIPDIGADEVQTVPTAAEVSLSGRVTNTNGQGIRNIRVVISGGNWSEPRLATTGSFGYFRFDKLTAGETYVVTVSGKRFVFTNPSRVVTLVDALADVDFVGRPR